jgi:hypothetical protein
MTGLFPDLGYIILLALLASTLLPILLLIVMNIILRRYQIKTVCSAILNFSFVILFFLFQRSINTSRSRYLITVLQIENLVIAGLLIFLIWKGFRIWKN